jgi:hypothetical protein
VMCPSSSSGMVAIPGFYEKPRPSARRFEVEDLARTTSSSSLYLIGMAASLSTSYPKATIKSKQFHQTLLFPISAPH